MLRFFEDVRSTRNVWVVGFLIVALFLQGILLFIAHHPEPRVLVGDETMYQRGALTLLAGEELYFESFWPPLQPVLLAFVLGLTGGSRLAVELFQTLMLIAAAFMLFDLALARIGSRVAAAVAGGLVLIHPPLVASAHFLWPEVTHLFFFIGVLWVLGRKPHSAPWIFAAGLLLGLALLSKYLLWPFLPLLAMVGSIRKQLLFLVAGMVIAIAPISASSQLRMVGTPVIDSATFNLWVGLNDRSRKDFDDAVVGFAYDVYKRGAPLEIRNALVWEDLRNQVESRGLLSLLGDQLGRQYFRLLNKSSVLTDQLPGGALPHWNVGYRDPPAGIVLLIKSWSYLLYALILVLSAVGIALAPPWAHRWSLFVLAFFGYCAVVFLLVHVKSRYRLQLLPFFFLYSGCAIAWLTARLGWNTGEAGLWDFEVGWGRWLVATVLSALLLFLAFGGPYLP